MDLLSCFLRHPGRAVGPEDLMREVWGWDFGDLSTVTVRVDYRFEPGGE